MKFSLVCVPVRGGAARGTRAHQIIETTKTRAFWTNTQSKFGAIVFDSVLSMPCLARHSWQCPWLSVVSETKAWGQSRALEGHCVNAKKSHSRVRDVDEGVAGGNGRKLSALFSQATWHLLGFFRYYVRDSHCNTLKPHLFAAFPSLHPFFYFASFCLQKDDIRTHKRGRTGAKIALWVNQFYYNEL